MNTPKNKQSQDKENECLECSIFLQVAEASHSQPIDLGEYEQLSLWKLTPMPNESSDITSQECQFTQISEITTQEKENSTLLQWAGRVQAHQTQEAKQDYLIQPHHSGEKDKKYCSKPNPSSVLWNNLKDLSDEDLELFLPPSIWQDTVGKLKQSRQQALTLDNRGTDYLSFPTLTSGQTNSKMRPAGQNGRFKHLNQVQVSRPPKCEKWFKDKGLIPSGYQLGRAAIANMMGFPSNWFEGLTKHYSNKKIISSQVKPQEESGQDTWQEEPLHQHKHRSLYLEFSISIPCLVKQPKQPEVKGVIREDLGDRFVVYIPHLDKSIAVSKLFVYPDFSKSVGQIPPSKKVTPPSKNSPTKQRRKKGDGTGYIYRRTITRKGKQYQESYYRYRDESGKLKAKYILQKLLYKVEEAESAKKPIADILVLLGGDEISRGEQSSTSKNRCVRREASPLGQNQGKSDEPISVSRGEQEQRPRVGVRRKGTRGSM